MAAWNDADVGRMDINGQWRYFGDFNSTKMMEYLIWMIKESKNSSMISILRDWASVVFKAMGGLSKFCFQAHLLVEEAGNQVIKQVNYSVCSVSGISEHKIWGHGFNYTVRKGLLIKWYLSIEHQWIRPGSLFGVGSSGEQEIWVQFCGGWKSGRVQCRWKCWRRRDSNKEEVV